MKQSGLRAAVKTVGSMICAALMLIHLDPAVRKVRDLPSDIYMESKGDALAPDFSGTLFTVMNESDAAVSGNLSQTLSGAKEACEAQYVIKLLGVPVKRVRFHLREAAYVIPGGSPVGVSMHTKGVLVVGLGSIDTVEGRLSPAAASGIKAGDVLLCVNGVEVEGSAHMAELTALHGKEGFEVLLLRDEKMITVRVTPKTDLADGQMRTGMWVRESTAGIGTLTYTVPEDKSFGALGHAVTDTDTGERLLIKKGELIRAGIVGVSVGQQGAPGELRGTFSSLSERIGVIHANTPCGIFGTLYEMEESSVYPDGLPIAYADEVKEGPVTILTSVDSEGVKEYSCEIIKLYQQDETNTKGIVIRVTDEALLEKTGGIVQGMSGSPIVQNGKLVGAVTHVLVNDPTRGYGIFIENMLEAAG